MSKDFLGAINNTYSSYLREEEELKEKIKSLQEKTKKTCVDFIPFKVGNFYKRKKDHPNLAATEYIHIDEIEYNPIGISDAYYEHFKVKGFTFFFNHSKENGTYEYTGNFSYGNISLCPYEMRSYFSLEILNLTEMFMLSTLKLLKGKYRNLINIIHNNKEPMKNPGKFLFYEFYENGFKTGFDFRVDVEDKLDSDYHRWATSLVIDKDRPATHAEIEYASESLLKEIVRRNIQNF